jgi:hypothetical protein
VVGTPGYLAPEQVLGGEVGPAVDVHAWGATVAMAGTGRPPYGTGRPEAVLYRIVHEEPDLDGLPADLADLVEQAMSRTPSDRPTAAQLLSRLGGASSAETVVVHLPRDVDATTVLAAGPGGRPAGGDLGWREAGGLVGASPGVARPTAALTRPLPPDAEPATVPTRRPAEPAALAPAGPVLRSVPQDQPYDAPYDPPPFDGAYDQAHHTAYDGRYDSPLGGSYERPADDVDHRWPDAPEEQHEEGLEPWDEGADRPSPARSAQVVVTALAALAVVATGALVAPVVTGIAALAGVVLLRAAGRSAERLALRRDRRGERRRDPVVSVLGLPWHLLAACADTLVSAPLLVLSAAVPAGVVWLADPAVDGLQRPELTASTALVVALAVALSRRSHRRTRFALRRALLTTTPSAAGAVAVVAVLGVSAALLLAAAEGSAPTWWPAEALVSELAARA